MLVDALQFIGAGLVALLGVASLRVAVDLLRDFPHEMARRRDPSNYEDRLVGMVVRDGIVQFKTKRTLKRRVYR